jgi:hypothetical protein
LPRLLRLVAPAGYGKTTLARALMARSASAGVCDLAYAGDPKSIVRKTIDLTVASEQPDRRRRVGDEMLALGESDAEWVAFGRRILGEAATSGPRVLCFENGESIAKHPDLRETVEDLVRDAAPQWHVILCSRVDLALRLGRFAGPDRTIVLGSGDLRFAEFEIVRAFEGIALDRAALERIAAFTRGWPIVVMMLRALAVRGRLPEYLAGRRDDADLYRYLADEVYGYLAVSERAVLEALAAIPAATEHDLAALFARFAPELSTLERDTPFVSRSSIGTIEVHPAMRDMLATRSDFRQTLERLVVALPRTDGGLRAAQIALELGRPRLAAEVLTDVGGGYLLSTLAPELVSVLSAMPADVLTAFPELWNNATMARASLMDPIAWIDEGERVYAACTPQTNDVVRAGVMLSLCNAYANRGRWAELERFAERAIREAGPTFAPLARTIANFWTDTVNLYRGRYVDTSRYFTDYALVTANSTGRALTDYDAVARQFRLLGDRHAERAALDRAVDIGVATGVPLVASLVVMDAAFGAWFWGEDSLCERYLAQLESLVAPSCARGVSHFIACMRGRAATTPVGVEKMKTRAYAFTIAAALERGAAARAMRIAYLHEAVVAADHADQPFAQVVARVPLALCLAGSEQQEMFNQAQRIADSTDSAAFAEAVRRARMGAASGTMFAALVRRFVEPPALVGPAKRACIDLRAGTIAIDGCSSRLRGREAELVTFLALRGNAHRDDIVDALWPELEGDRARATLKTHVSRLRSSAGERNFIVFDETGYRLGAQPTVRSGTPVSARFLNWPWFSALALRA